MNDTEKVFVSNKVQNVSLKNIKTYEEITIPRYQYENYTKEEKAQYEIIDYTHNYEDDIEKIEIDSYKSSYKTIEESQEKKK